MLIGAKCGQRYALTPINVMSIPHTISSQLYFNGAIGSTTFTDHTGKSWTRIGTPSIVDSISDPSARMGYFNGSGDAITTVAHADFAFGTGDFTIELWAATSSRNSAYECLVDLTSGTTINNGSRIAIFVNTTGTVFTEFRDTTGTYIGQVSAAGWVDGPWHHVALTRVNGVFKLALNGRFGTPVAYNINYSATQRVRIGWPLNQGASEAFFGWFENFQVVKGAALFTQDFTPTFTRLTTLPLIVSQLNLDQANDSTTFTDQTGKAWTRTGQVVVTSAQSVSGGASAYFEGSSDYITTPHHADFNVGAMDFTLEIRCKQEIVYSTAYPCLVAKRDTSTSNNSFVLWFHIATNRFVFTASYSGGDPYVSGIEAYGPTITQDTNVWHHVAVVREGTTLRVFCDGVGGPAANIGTNAIFNSTNPLGLGTDGAGGLPSSVNCWRGWLDDFRFTRGRAWYTFNRPSPGPYYAHDEQLPPDINIYNKLRYYYTLSESNGTPFFKDSHGGMDLYAIADSTIRGNMPAVRQGGGTSTRFDSAHYAYVMGKPDWMYRRGDFAVSAWVKFDSTAHTTTRTLLTTADNVDATEAQNYVVDVSLINDGQARMFWEYGVGVNVSSYPGGSPLIEPTPTLLTMSRSSGPQKTTEFRGDSIVGETTYTTPPTGGTDAAMWLTVGNTVDLDMPTLAQVQDLAIFDAPLTHAEHVWLHNAGVGRSYDDICNLQGTYTKWTPTCLNYKVVWAVADHLDNTVSGGFVTRLANLTGWGYGTPYSGISTNQFRVNVSTLNGRPVLSGLTGALGHVGFAQTRNRGRSVRGFTVAILTRQTAASMTNRILVALPTETSNVYQVAMSRNPSSIAGAVNIGGRRLVGDTYASITDSVDYGTSWVILIGQYDFISGTFTIRVNGTQTATSGSGPTVGRTSTTIKYGDIHLGGSWAGGSVNGEYEVAEFIFQDEIAPIDDIVKTEGYLAHEWGLADSLPVDHPYKLRRPEMSEYVQVPPRQQIVTSLMSFEGAHNGTVFIDTAGNTWTRAGNAVTSTVQKKFGTSSGYFDGSNDYLTTTDRSQFRLLNHDFCIEGWLYIPSIPNDYLGILSVRNNSGSNFSYIVYIDNFSMPGVLGFEYGTSGTSSAGVVRSAGSVPLGEWFHYAVERYNNQIVVYVNGVGGTPLNVANATFFNSTVNPTLGKLSVGLTTNGFYGYMDEFRLTNGDAVYKGNFTPPVAPFNYP